jgi:hypothetical protein
MKPRVSGVTGSSSSTKSEVASTVSVSAGPYTCSTWGIGAGRSRVPITRISRASALRATSWPITPRPRMPSVVPASVSETRRRQRRSFWSCAMPA